jgi:Catalytic LigB subunit of aromatic ring-opening dioxygenase
MGEILGLGLSHYPGFMYRDEQMAGRLKSMLADGLIPLGRRDPGSWPEPMRAEWGSDEGTSFAARHRAEFLAGVARVRKALDEFAPDAVVMCGDDQYENFREDLIPPFAVYIQDSFETQPLKRGRRGLPPSPNVWGRSPDTVVRTAGHPDAARLLVTGLLNSGFDIAYAYRGLHHEGLGHAFINSVLYLDYCQEGWPYRLVPLHVNAYGSKIVRQKGGVPNQSAAAPVVPDPPGPSPARCFALGRAIAQVLAPLDLRVALIATSSWSHAFLTEKTGFLHPDIEADHARYDDLRSGRYPDWEMLDPAQLEASGQQELLNWLPLAGAMTECGAGVPLWCDLAESYTMNSSKCSVVFRPVRATVDPDFIMPPDSQREETS